MRVYDVAAAIEEMKQHKQFFIDAYGSFSDMPKTDKARCDEIDNFIACLINHSKNILTRYITITLKYYFPPDIEEIQNKLIEETDWLDEDVRDYDIWQSGEDTVINLQLSFSEIPGAEVTPAKKVKEMFLEDIGNSVFVTPLLVGYDVEVEDE